jgi:hypothetical protein
MKLANYMRRKLLQLMIDGTLERYGEGVDARTHVAKIFVCARSYREMAALISERLPDQKVNATLIVINGQRGWPQTMRWVKPKIGVWVSGRCDALLVYEVLSDGQRIEVD